MVQIVLLFAGICLSAVFGNPTSPVLKSELNDFPKESKAGSTVWKTLDGSPTVFFAHRGENVLVTGHTLPAYEIAAIEQAEYVEPDLVLTKDGILVCYHDLTLKKRTDVEDYPEFDHLKMNYTGIIGIVHKEIVNDYFIQNFTLAELKKLKVIQTKVGIRPHYFDNFQIPTFQEYLDVMHRTTITLNKTIGIIPELKHAVFQNRFQPSNFMENQFLQVLAEYGYPLKENSKEACMGARNDSAPKQTIKCPPVIIQSFEKVTLEYLKTQTDLDLMMLVDPEVTLLTYEGLKSVSTIAKWYCVWKEYMYVGVEAELKYREREYDPDVIDGLGGFIPAKEFVSEAHRLGMKMTLFTINDSREDSRKGCAIRCEPENKRDELFYYFEMGIDGIFIEGISESIQLRLSYEHETSTGSSGTRSTIAWTAKIICLFTVLKFVLGN